MLKKIVISLVILISNNTYANDVEGIEEKADGVESIAYDKLKDFNLRLKLSPQSKPVVDYPLVARGDMNIFKYIQFLPDEQRPLVIFRYKGEAKGHNLNALRGHLESSLMKEGFDYIFINSDEKKENISYKNRKKISYQQFDNILSDKTIFKAAQTSLREIADHDEEIKSYFSEKGIDAHTPRERKDKLIMVNINHRNLSQKDGWEPRELRHSTDLDVTKQILEVILDIPSNGDNRDVCLVGSSFTDEQIREWEDFGIAQNTTIYFLNDMTGQLDRRQQRAAQFKFADRYRETTYFGLQSGVNEDAVVLPRTNVVSMSEYLGIDQVGIGRVEARTQLDQFNRSQMIGQPRTTNNFYSLRNNEFLSTRGIFAAIQLKHFFTEVKNNEKIQSFDDIWQQVEINAENEDFPLTESFAVGEMCQLIFGKSEPELNEEEHYRDSINALRVIARRQLGDDTLSDTTKDWLSNVMQKIMQPHDKVEATLRKNEIDSLRNADRVLQKISQKHIKRRERVVDSLENIWE